MELECPFCGWASGRGLPSLLWHVIEQHEYAELDFLPGRWVCWVGHRPRDGQVRCWCGHSYWWLHDAMRASMHNWDRHIEEEGGLGLHLFHLALGIG